MAEGKPGYGEAAPGDHLQTSYDLWLVGTSSSTAGRRGAIRTASNPRSNRAGTSPVGRSATCYWPLQAALGTVLAWNVFLLLGFLGAGGFTALWLREVGTPRGASLAGGLAFAMAPYLQAQWSAGHLLAWIAMLLPLSLYGLRAGEEGIGLVARPGRGRTRLDPALGPAAPRARSDPVLRRVRARATPLGRSAGRARTRRRAARRCTRRARHDRGERPPVPAGRALLREPAGLPLARHARARRDRLRRLDGRGARRRRARRARPSAPLGDGARARARRADPILSLSAGTCQGTTSSGSTCPAYETRGARADDADRLSRARRGSSPSQSRGCAGREPPPRSLSCSYSSTCGSGSSINRRRPAQPRVRSAPATLAGTTCSAPRVRGGQPERERLLYYLMQAPHQHPSGYSTTAPLTADRRLPRSSRRRRAAISAHSACRSSSPTTARRTRAADGSSPAPDGSPPSGCAREPLGARGSPTRPADTHRGQPHEARDEGRSPRDLS